MSLRDMENSGSKFNTPLIGIPKRDLWKTRGETIYKDK